MPNSNIGNFNNDTDSEFGNNDMNSEFNHNDADSEFGDNEMDSEFDNNDEESPKKEIQSLTGKLSQALRSYNQENDDSELNKYVAGMIIPQATEFMTNKDKKEIINRINKNNPLSDDDNSIEDNELDNNSNDESNDENSMNEVFNNLLDKDKNRDEKKLLIKPNKKNPFVSNR